MNTHLTSPKKICLVIEVSILFLLASNCTGLCQLKWEFYASGYGSWTSPSIAPDGSVYFASQRGFYALNSNGSEKWYVDLPNGINADSAIATDGTIYFVEPGGNLYAMNSDGSTNWISQIDSIGGTWGSIAVAPNGTIYCGGDKKFVSLKPDGTTNWIYTETNFPFSPTFQVSFPAIAEDGTVYVNGSENQLYAFNTNGSIKWVFNIYPELYRVPAPSIASDGTIYFSAKAATNAYFLAVRPDGTIKWQYVNSSLKEFGTGASIGSDGTIYTLGLFPTTSRYAEGNLYAFNSDGTVKWVCTNSILTEFLYRISTPAVTADGTIYIGGADGRLFAINSSGTLNWVSDYLGGEIHSSPSIGPDGTIYVSDLYGNPSRIYAFNGSSPLACSYWPQSGKNNRHSSSTSILKMQNPLYGTNQGFSFNITGATGLVCNVCATTNLVASSWTNIGSISLEGLTNFVDLNATNHVKRFYRLTEQ
jgi:PQQ-like domain